MEEHLEKEEGAFREALKIRGKRKEKAALGGDLRRRILDGVIL
jgi:hypothetical protein